MDRLDAMELAVAAIDEGSLAAAARRLGRSAAAATRAIALLEASAGETLLLRSTRGLRLTEAGERHAAIWRDVLARLAEAREGQAAKAIGGTLVLTAPELFGRLKVAPVLESFLERHPEVQARALLLNRMVDMMGEGIDLAIRLAHLHDSGLVAVRLGEVRQVVCASPAYLARHGPPREPAELSGHRCIGVNPDGNRELWTFRQKPGGARTRSIQVHTRLSITSVGAGLDAALRGQGLMRALSYQVAELLSADRLRRVLTPYEPEAVPVNMIFRPNPRPWSPVRGFVDHAVPILRRELTQVAAVVDWLPTAEE
ncbi:LysR family transcriptional regulator [Roseomonas marmotae]|uniref:LysR family transcriptional regulator n=1 Tax=Roseomonas marmotae TaxID=2768161 RepID=A0ABS3KDF6_9PROT|nr:LysR family transcriptional regulator [Roseomonas marmotae]MBO1075465.1 LysR family transcriptional regulator [Roseomonas marmotae]QTI81415.1 LysR family transcriptional regulator [Roseomonas marmotae]